MRPKGVLFVVSYGIPDNRLQYLENEDYSWTVTVHTIRESMADFIMFHPLSSGFKAARCMAHLTLHACACGTAAKPTVSATAVPDTKDANSVHYIYVCQKGGGGDADDS